MAVKAQTNKAQSIGPGRPRSDSSKEALLGATFELLREVGFERMAMDTIAGRAGVGKMTIYRWYSNKETLVLEALKWAAERDSAPAPDTGSLAGDLQAQLKQRMASDPMSFNRESAALSLSAMAANDDLSRAYWDLYIVRKREILTKAFDRAKKRGEIAKNADLEIFLDMYFGYVMFRLLMHPDGQASLKDIKKAVNTLIAGFKP